MTSFKRSSQKTPLYEVSYKNDPKTSLLKTTKLNLTKIGLIVLLLSTQSCYHYRVSSANFDPSTHYKKKTVNSFLWGAVQKRTNGIDVVTSNCDSLKINKLDEVRVTTNFGYALITVATLGIWCPIQIEWKCPKPCQRVGTIP